MSFSRSEDDLNPEDPLNYAPSAVLSEANLQSNSIPPTRSLVPVSSRSKFDELLEEALAKSMRRHQLESEFVYERRQPRLLLAVTGGIAAGIGITVIIACVFLTLVPKSQKSDPSELAVSTPASAGAAQTPPEESQALLQKFVQWQQRQ